MKIAIIGAAGQVGRGLMQAFRTRPDLEAFGITRNTMSAAPLLAAGLDVRVGAVADPAAAPELLRGADVVVNCALEIDRPKRARARNEQLVASLLAHARAALVVHCSSVAVYGSCVDSTVSTWERPRPDSTYGREKLHLERFALAEAAPAGQRLLILRLGHVYGPGQGISREAFDVLREGRWPLPFGGALPSNALHVAHLAAAIPPLAGTPALAGVLNATDSPQRTWAQVYAMHAAAAGREMPAPMPEAESLRLREEFRRMARMPLATRVPLQVGRWLRQLPLKSLVGVTAVRQATEAALLALPPRVEQLVDRRYAVFSAGHALEVEGAAAPDGPPPWFYSDGVPGPALPAQPETEARMAGEVEALRRWYAEWASPAWRTAAARESQP